MSIDAQALDTGATDDSADWMTFVSPNKQHLMALKG